MKNKILNGITGTMFMTMLICMASMDSKDITIPVIGLCVSAAWLLLFAHANKDMVGDR